jgi:MFS family permease
MASAHPVITSYFDSSNSASWLSTVFYLSSTVSQPLYGRTSDTVGRRPVYIFAQVVFLLSTAWCALAPNIGSFIAARLICGLGAGGVMSVSNIIISDIVKIEHRGIYRESQLSNLKPIA